MKIEFVCPIRSPGLIQDRISRNFTRPIPPAVVARLEAETIGEAEWMRKMFGEFKTDPPVLHLESESQIRITKWDESYPCEETDEILLARRK
jgi:hypothetical protein